jgi:membrane protease YdiL (CAAX protease family)
LFARYANWMTTPMHKSLCVLMGHTTWIVLASMILRLIPRPQPFFQQPKSMWFTSQYKNKSKSKSDNIANNETSSIESKQQQWIWWVLGGYFVSCWLYNISDILNSYIFPLSILLQAEENSVVGSLLNTFDVKASLIGYIAPCITAPWFEEILYRGYILPTLLLWLPSSRSKSKNSNSSSTSLKQPSKDSSNKSSLSYQLAIFISGILFSIHHQSELAFLPLCILGWLWAIIYTKSGNLWTTILIHSMWNSRIFIGGWFGL